MPGPYSAYVVPFLAPHSGISLPGETGRQGSEVFWKRLQARFTMPKD